MRKEKRGTKFTVFILVIALVVMAFTACSQDQGLEQSKALVALESVVSWYENQGTAEHWEDLMALCFANYADGIAVDWSRVTLPDAEMDSSDAGSYIGAIITDIIKGEGNAVLYTDQLQLLQNPETGAFAPDQDLSVHIYSMLALNISLGPDSYDYVIAADYLLDHQTADGGFATAESDSREGDVFLTGLASAALAPHLDGSREHRAELDRLSQFFIDRQEKNGGYLDNNGRATAEVTAAAICGLTALNLALPEAADSGLTPLDALLKFQNSDGTFRQLADAEKTGDPQATRRAAIALCDIVNDMNTFHLLASDSEAYRIENASGPQITLIIEYPEDTGLQSYNGPFTIESNSNVFDAIIFYGLSAKTPVTFSGSVNARSIEGISDLKNGDYGEGSCWIYYVNGQLSPFPPSAVRLEEGDHLKWVYVHGEEAAAVLSSLDAITDMLEIDTPDGLS